MGLSVPIFQDDWANYTPFTAAVGDSVQIVGDDLLVTNPSRIQEAGEKKACNALLLKVICLDMYIVFLFVRACVCNARVCRAEVVTPRSSGDSCEDCETHVCCALCLGLVARWILCFYFVLPIAAPSAWRSLARLMVTGCAVGMVSAPSCAIPQWLLEDELFVLRSCGICRPLPVPTQARSDVPHSRWGRNFYMLSAPLFLQPCPVNHESSQPSHPHRRPACAGMTQQVNQIGSVSESIKAVKMSKQLGWGVMTSHRSGETEDNYIADIAVGLCTGQIKTGAPCRSERLAKYNQARYDAGVSILAQSGLDAAASNYNLALAEWAFASFGRWHASFVCQDMTAADIVSKHVVFTVPCTYRLAYPTFQVLLSVYDGICWWVFEVAELLSNSPGGKALACCTFLLTCALLSLPLNLMPYFWRVRHHRCCVVSADGVIRAWPMVGGSID